MKRKLLLFLTAATILSVMIGGIFSITAYAEASIEIVTPAATEKTSMFYSASYEENIETASSTEYVFCLMCKYRANSRCVKSISSRKSLKRIMSPPIGFII